jgi:hypothetical protein
LIQNPQAGRITAWFRLKMGRSLFHSPPMKCLSRSALLTLATVTAGAHAAADPALVGCWRAARIVLHTQDGSKAEDTSGRCTLQFTADRLESTCKTSSGAATTTYRYEIVRPGVYAATMAGSTFRTEMVGSTREYAYSVDGDQLRTVSPPAAKGPAVAPTGGPRVQTESVRSPCP